MRVLQPVIPEYPLTLDTEYRRDLAKGLPIEMPRTTLRGRQTRIHMSVMVAAHANLLFSQLAELLSSGNPVHIEEIINKNLKTQWVWCPLW